MKITFGWDAEYEIAPVGFYNGVCVCLCVYVVLMSRLALYIEAPTISKWMCEWMGECWRTL